MKKSSKIAVRIAGAGLVLLIAAATAAPTPRAGLPPASQAGTEPIGYPGFWICPQDAGITAYLPSRLYYSSVSFIAPDYGIRPSRCFHTAADAEANGFKPAPGPPGSQVVAGVYLLPTGHDDVGACHRAARRLGFVVPCPGLLPAGLSLVSGCPTEDRQDLGGGKECAYIGEQFRQFVFESRFDAAAGYEGVGPMVGHLFIAAVRSTTPMGGSVPISVSCRGDTGVDVEPGPVILGEAAVWVTCPDGSGQDSGHIVLAWSIRDVAYEVSLHGHNQTNRDIDLLIASHLQFIQP
jgi:hypothetical protein